MEGATVDDQAAPSAQKEQHELVKGALKQPGVAEAIQVFNAASPYVPQPSIALSSGVGYATGGNKR